MADRIWILLRRRTAARGGGQACFCAHALDGGPDLGPPPASYRGAGGRRARRQPPSMRPGRPPPVREDTAGRPPGRGNGQRGLVIGATVHKLMSPARVAGLVRSAAVVETELLIPDKSTEAKPAEVTTPV